MKTPYIILATTLLLFACASPSRWAEALETQLKCGMSVKDVETVSQKTVQTMEVPRGWVTHFLRDGSTDVWLGFRDDKLESVQVAWAEKMMKMATYQRIDLCQGKH